MKPIRIYLREDLDRKFRKISMASFGYSRGSLSKAAAEALEPWVRAREGLAEVDVPSEPVKVVRGILSHVKKTSVQLQHEAPELRAMKAKGER